MRSRHASLQAPKPPGTAGVTTSAGSWPGPSNIATFLRCLRLLDLDRLEDWPGIIEQTFSTKSGQQNLQQRIKGVEWSLYRLFELYDAAECRNKLRPFFPPQSSLQSLNLRAALFRILTELKKNGVLEKDVVLRKTTLDECKGDKFEELVGNFAIVVLRKVAKTRHPGLSESIERLEQDQLLPMIVAYRVNLYRLMRQKEQTRVKANAFAKHLGLASAALETRRESLAEPYTVLDGDSVPGISSHIRSVWTGDDRWTDVLLGQDYQPGHGLLDQSFETGWSASVSDHSSETNHAKSLLADLEDRVAQQKARLERWQTFRSSLQEVRKPRAVDKPKETVVNAPRVLLFNQHQSLQLNSANLPGSDPPQLLPKHKALLDALRADLSSSRQVSGDQSPIRSGARSTLPNASTIIPDAAALESSVWPGTTRATASERLVPEPDEQSTAGDIGADTASLTAIEKTDYPKSETDSMEPHDFEELLAADTDHLQSHDITMEPDLPSSPPVALDRSSQIEPMLLPPHRDKSTTLLERTRQSMSMVPNQPPTSRIDRRKSVKQSRFSGIFPVNQFETPGRSTVRTAMASPRSGSSTPRDKLFSEEADYASIFKSRPKIALSPTLSPDRSTFEVNSVLEEEMDGLDFQEEDDGLHSTPTRAAT